jgi:1-acyl-sn-glycerol-3-phosphate acyltransferase
MIQLFHDNEELMLMIPAEGTRSLVKKWKTGFYHVALGANVPVLLGYLDYEKKQAGFGPLLYMTGDPIVDANAIKDFYRGIKGRFPEKFYLDGLVLD